MVRLKKPLRDCPLQQTVIETYHHIGPGTRLLEYELIEDCYRVSRGMQVHLDAGLIGEGFGEHKTGPPFRTERIVAVNVQNARRYLG